MTETDTLHLVIEQFGDLDVFHAVEAEVGHRLALNEVIAVEMATVKAPLEDVVAWLLEHARVRAGFAELVRRHDPLIVSAGFHELIEPVLEREGVQGAVVANHVVDGPGRMAGHLPRAPTSCVGVRRGVQAAGRHRGGRARLCRRRRFRPLRLARRGPGVRSRRSGPWLDERGSPYERYDDLRDVLVALD